MTSERDIDDAIDRAVRDFMSVEPRTGLRGRVLAELESRGTEWFSLPRLAGAAAVVAAGISLGLFIWSLTIQDPVQPATLAGNEPAEAAAPRAPASVPAASSASQADRTLKPAPSAPRSSAAPRRPQFPAPGAVTAANLGARSMRDAALPEGTARSAPAAAGAPDIVIPMIQIQPLVIDTIVIDPIRPPR